MITGILMNESMVKNHISLKTGLGYNATRRTSFLLWFQACQRVLPPVLILHLQRQFQDRRGIVLHLLQVHLLQQRHRQVFMRFEREYQSEIDSFPVLVSSSTVDIERRTRCGPSQ